MSPARDVLLRRARPSPLIVARGVVLDVPAARRAGRRRARPAACRAARSSASTTRRSRSAARASAALARRRPPSGRTGVTMVISSFTASNTTIERRAASTIASGRPIGSGLAGRQFLHQAHHVVAEIAEDAGRHRRQAVRQLDRDSRRSARAAPSKRRLGAGREARRLGARACG